MLGNHCILCDCSFHRILLYRISSDQIFSDLFFFGNDLFTDHIRTCFCIFADPDLFIF